MGNSRHGKYEITLLDDGRIVHVHFIGSWNLPTVLAFFDDLKKQPLASKWVALGDMTTFNGWTPETDEAYQRVVDWALQNGEAGAAIILGDDIKTIFTTRSEERRSVSVPTCHFDDVDSAIAWCRELLREQLP